MSHRAFDGYTAIQTAPGIDGYNTVIRAQSSSGAGANGGDLVLMAGEGANRDGYVRISVDGYDRIVVGPTGAAITATALTAISITAGTLTATNLIPSDILFDGYNVSPSITQNVMPVSGADGYHLLINAQSSADAFAHGGDLLLHGGDGYNGDGYYRDGYIKLFSGATEQARVVPNKFSMLTGQRIKLTHIDAGTDGYILANDYLIMVDTSVSRQIHLPLNPIEGDIYQIKDKTGLANANPITVNGNGYNIDGNPTYTINATNYPAVLFVYGGTQWGVL